MDIEILEIISAFVHEEAFNHAITDVVSATDSGVFLSYEDKRIHNRYNGSEISFHKCLFPLMGYCLPFNKFEVSILNHLLIYPSQLHPMS